MDWPILGSLTDDEIRAVIARARRRRFRRGEVVFHREDPADSLHLVVSGSFAVRVITPRGDVATLSLVGPGEIFGELSLLLPQPSRTATVEALTAAETHAIPRSELEALRRTHTEIDRFLAELMSGRVARLTDRLVDALYTPAPDRVRGILRELADRYRGPEGAVVPLTQDDLAGLAGTSRLTVSRVLGDMRRAGEVEVGRGRITVHLVD